MEFETSAAKSTAGPRLRFCPESNDLLYPREDRERQVLIFYCKSCNYQEDADKSGWLVYRLVTSIEYKKTMLNVSISHIHAVGDMDMQE